MRKFLDCFLFVNSTQLDKKTSLKLSEVAEREGFCTALLPFVTR